MGKIILVVVIIIILGAGGYFISKNRMQTGAPAQNSTSTNQNPAPQNQTQTVNISNFSFVPPSVTIKVGTTIKWTNEDSATHRVHSSTGVFDSGNLAQGNSYEFQFNTVGTYDYICSIHTSMKGKIIVTQ